MVMTANLFTDQRPIAQCRILGTYSGLPMTPNYPGAERRTFPLTTVPAPATRTQRQPYCPDANDDMVDFEPVK